MSTSRYTCFIVRTVQWGLGGGGWGSVAIGVQFQLEDCLQKKKECFCIAKTKRPEKDITVSAKVLRKCSASSLILLWQPKSAKSALSSMVFEI